MTTNEQIKALAELDGCRIAVTNSQGCNIVLKGGTICTLWNEGNVDGDIDHYLEKLTTSYDAIIPLIQKQDKGIKVSIREQLYEIWWLSQPEEICLEEFEIWLITATPAQLCEALLRATDKWKD